jgi:hypothetical protein
MQAHQRKVDIYTREWGLPQKPVSTYYTFRFLREALDELGLLRSWDPALDAASRGSTETAAPAMATA